MRLGAADFFTFESNLARIRNKRARYQIEQRGFASSVGTNQTDDLALRNVQVHAEYGGQTSEMLAYLLHFKYLHVCLQSLLFAAQR